MLLSLFIALGAGALVAAACNLWIVAASRGALYRDAAQVPAGRVAVVLGAGPFSLALSNRLDAAAELYRHGKVDCLIVSGDNHIHGYNEPEIMKQGLVHRGIPAAAIVCDYAGFRTLDSVLRARVVFGLDRIVLVSQRFHNYRAVWLARRHGLEAVACDAAGTTAWEAWRWEAREAVARVVAVLDVYLWHRQARFMGPPEPLFPRPHPPQAE